jgi:hypothetical protein
MKRLTIAFWSLLGPAAFAATAPFTENFDSYDNTTNPTIVPTGFSESTGASWNVRDDGAGNDYENAGSQTSSNITIGYRFATVSLTNMANTDFTMSAELTVDSISGTGSTLNNFYASLIFFGSDPAFAPGYTAEIDVLGPGSGNITISKNDSVLVSGSITGTLATGTIYTMSVTGTQVGSSLNLGFNFSGGGTSGSISYLDTAPTRSGTAFGFRDVIVTGSGGTVNYDLDYDNLSIIPEPTSASLLLLGVGLSLNRRWRKAARS